MLMNLAILAAFCILVYVLVDEIAEGQIGGRK